MLKRKKRLPNAVFLRTDSILHTKLRPKKLIPAEDIKRLCESIARFGIINPITVREKGRNFELVAGEKRLIAARMLDFEFVPCIITDAPTKLASEMAFAENFVRTGNSFFDDADVILHLMKTQKLSAEEISVIFGIAPSEVASKMRIEKFRPEERIMIKDGGLSEKAAQKIISLGDIEKRIFAITRAAEENLGIKEIERLVFSLAEKDSDFTEKKPKATLKGSVKNLSMLENSIEKAISFMVNSGISADFEKAESTREITYKITVQKAS